MIQHYTDHKPVMEPVMTDIFVIISVLTLGLRLPNERRHYFVTTSLIAWAQA